MSRFQNRDRCLKKVLKSRSPENCSVETEPNYRTFYVDDLEIILTRLHSPVFAIVPSVQPTRLAITLL